MITNQCGDERIDRKESEAAEGAYAAKMAFRPAMREREISKMDLARRLNISEAAV